MNRLALGAGPEFDRIRGILVRLGDRAAGVGDDCALIPDGPTTLAMSCDLSLENVHFRRAWLSAEEIGWRAAAAALSDLAAEGASVLGLEAAVGVPRETPSSDLEALMAGIGAAVTDVGGRVLGGDLSSAPMWTIAITVLGRAVRPVTRGGALPGDRLWVTGMLGGARAALEDWLEGRTPDPEARAAFAHPVPRIGAGQWLATRGARAMMDLSDGLAGDATHLAAASGRALEIELDTVPVTPSAIAAADRAGVAPAAFAAQGGEDYELLVAMPPEFGSEDARRLQLELGLSLTCIGAVAEGSGTVLRLRGAPVHLASFDHFP